MPNTSFGGQQPARGYRAGAGGLSPASCSPTSPTGNLDSAQRSVEVMSILQGLNDHGITVVLVTHDARVARHAQRVLHISDGGSC